MKNVIKPTATRLLIPLGLAAPASATETAIYENVWIWSSSFTLALNTT